MNKHIGSTLTSLLDELDEREEVDLLARKKVLADGIRERMHSLNVTQVELAKKMNTSRTVVHRLLDPSDTGVTLGTLAKASWALGMALDVVMTPKSKMTRPKRSPARSLRPIRRARIASR